MIVGGLMKSENVLSIFIDMNERKVATTLHDISVEYSVSERTAKDYIKSIRNVIADKNEYSKALVYDRSLKKYSIK